jgi:hypothetical protein
MKTKFWISAVAVPALLVACNAKKTTTEKVGKEAENVTESVKDLVETTGEKAAKVTAEAKEKMAKAAEEAKAAAHEAKEKIEKVAEDAAQKVIDETSKKGVEPQEKEAEGIKGPSNPE